MNEITGEYQYEDESFKMKFYKNGDLYVLDSSFGSISLDYTAYKTIISKIIDIYSETYPLGTVVELEAELQNVAVDVEFDGRIKVVILNRFAPLDDKLFFYYTGTIYPVFNTGEQINMIHFTPSMIKRVVHEGYSDEYDVEYVKNKKREMLFDKRMHSTEITTAQEVDMIRQNAGEN